MSIPTVCHHEKLKPFGGCRLCTVEAEAGGRTNLVAACIYPVQQGLVVRTRSEQIDKIRKVLTEQLLAYAPESEVLQNLAREYRADKDRFAKEPSFCILCGLCVRYCAEIKQKNAVGFMDRGPSREISLCPGDRRQGVLGLQGMFPALPHFGITGGLRFDEIAGIHRLLQLHQRRRTHSVQGSACRTRDEQETC